MKEAVPYKIGKYEVIEELGQGAMGTVFKAFDPIIKREVAIKTINKKVIQDQGANLNEIMARFEREAQMAGRLNHPNIVSVFDYIETPETAFIVMEIVKGTALKVFFDDNKKFNRIEDVVKIMDQLLDALFHSHEHGVIHRDIKPANIIVMSDYTIKIADFGIATFESSELTQFGSLLGTPSYMSPEQIRGEKIDFRSDLFSAGVIFYQLLTGKKPFYASEITAMMHKILNEDPVSPSQLNSQLPPLIDQVIQTALAKLPSNRYTSADDFKIAIRSIFLNQPGHGEETLYVSRHQSEFEKNSTDVQNNHNIEIDNTKTIFLTDIYEKTDFTRDANNSPTKMRRMLYLFVACLLVVGSVLFAYKYLWKTNDVPHEITNKAFHEVQNIPDASRKDTSEKPHAPVHQAEIEVSDKQETAIEASFKPNLSVNENIDNNYSNKIPAAFPDKINNEAFHEIQNIPDASRKDINIPDISRKDTSEKPQAPPVHRAEMEVSDKQETATASFKPNLSVDENIDNYSNEISENKIVDPVGITILKEIKDPKEFLDRITDDDSTNTSDGMTEQGKVKIADSLQDMPNTQNLSFDDELKDSNEVKKKHLEKVMKETKDPKNFLETLMRSESTN
ncbi:MAG: serine/threonine protein kinase [Desulfamplus sp.]|nr:serine/threonine protein kinase [Desulfamplus sp.]